MCKCQNSGYNIPFKFFTNGCNYYYAEFNINIIVVFTICAKDLRHSATYFLSG